ncbi:MAG: nickel pincer cofactor biosynthesis protein LarB [SAR324 cluster bacterium]|nr:nickel pincer cofactor biosynthesis protein LarB [SAR324 cluster bacterium]
MNQTSWLELFEAIKHQQIEPVDALDKVQSMSYQNLGFAKLDHGRELRKGFPEVIYAKDKTVDQLTKILKAHCAVHMKVLVTRLAPEKWENLKKQNISGHYNSVAQTLSLIQGRPESNHGNILILTAGTSDLPVAEEALETARIMGNKTEIIADVGVAGIHRLIDQMHFINQAKVIIVVAGMDGALPSVVGGLVSCPVIAVPTSIGYGTGIGGIAALLAMLNSCAPGVMVVNIDNGFGAGYAASMINHPGSAQTH